MALQKIFNEDITIEQLGLGMPDPDCKSMLKLCYMEAYLLQLSSHVLYVFIESATTLHTLYRDIPDSEFWKCLTGHPLKVELCYQHFRNSKLLPGFKYIQLVIVYSEILLKEDESRFTQYIQDNRTCFHQIVREITDKDKLDLFLDIMMYFLNFQTSTSEARETVCELFCESVMTTLTEYGKNKSSKICTKISETSVTSIIICLLLDGNLLLKTRQTQLVQYLLTTSDKKRWSCNSDRTFSSKHTNICSREIVNMFVEFISNHYQQLFNKRKHDNPNFDRLFNEFYRHSKETKANHKHSEMLVLVMFLLLTVTPGGKHKSAKLKKYLALKYEYEDIILYILWCAGDIESNPGPRQRKSLLPYDSWKERDWIQSMIAIILKLYWGHDPNNKVKNLWSIKPDHYPLNTPFYDTKNMSKDVNGNSIPEEDLLTNLLDCCKKKNVGIPNLYQTEIMAWTKYRAEKTARKIYRTILFALYAFRTMTDTLKANIQNLYFYKDTLDLEKMLKKHRIILTFEGKACYINKRLKGKSEIVAEITRYLATILCKISKQLDPEKKHDKIWNEPPKGWLKNVPFFNPYNRGKYKDPKIKLCSDHDLVETFLQLPQVISGIKSSHYEQLIEAYQVYRDNKNNNKKHKEELCQIFTTQTNVSELANALQHLHEARFFRSEVYNPLYQWWTTETANEADVEKLSLTTNTRQSAERPNIVIFVDENSIVLLTVTSDPDSHSNTPISYCIPISDYSTPTFSTISLQDNDSQTQPSTSSTPRSPASNVECYTDSSSLSSHNQANDECSTQKRTKMTVSLSKDTNEQNQNDLQGNTSVPEKDCVSQCISSIPTNTSEPSRSMQNQIQGKAKKRKITQDMPEPTHVKKTFTGSLLTENKFIGTNEKKPATDSSNTNQLDLDIFSTVMDHSGLSPSTCCTDDTWMS